MVAKVSYTEFDSLRGKRILIEASGTPVECKKAIEDIYFNVCRSHIIDIDLDSVKMDEKSVFYTVKKPSYLDTCYMYHKFDIIRFHEQQDAAAYLLNLIP